MKQHHWMKNSPTTKDQFAILRLLTVFVVGFWVYPLLTVFFYTVFVLCGSAVSTVHVFPSFSFYHLTTISDYYVLPSPLSVGNYASCRSHVPSSTQQVCDFTKLLLVWFVAEEGFVSVFVLRGQAGGKELFAFALIIGDSSMCLRDHSFCLLPFSSCHILRFDIHI